MNKIILIRSQTHSMKLFYYMVIVWYDYAPLFLWTCNYQTMIKSIDFNLSKLWLHLRWVGSYLLGLLFYAKSSMVGLVWFVCSTIYDVSHGYVAVAGSKFYIALSFCFGLFCDSKWKIRSTMGQRKQSIQIHTWAWRVLFTKPQLFKDLT